MPCKAVENLMVTCQDGAYAPRSTPFQTASIQLNLPNPDNRDIRTLPELIEFNAVHNSDYLFCLQAGRQQRFLPVTHRQLKEAILCCSDWLVANVKEIKLPKVREDGTIERGQPVALLMESDVGLWIYLLSLLSLGIPALLLSARLSADAITHLLLKTSAAVIIVAPRLQRTAADAVSAVASSSVVPETCPRMQQSCSYESFVHDSVSSQRSILQPYHYVNDVDRDVLILHSSGTTGLPKPIYSSHRYLLGFTACHDFADKKDCQGLNVSTLPLFHGYGLVAPCLSSGVGMQLCLPDPSTISRGSSTLELIRTINATSLMTVPSILEEIVLLPDGEGPLALKHLRFVAFGGGLVKPSVGKTLISNGVKLLNHYGATEIGPIAPIFEPTPEYDYQYFRIRKDMDVRLELMQSSKIGEQHYKLIARPFGWTTDLVIQDQLIGNPKNPGVEFKAVGRSDDMIVMATGEKVVPHIMESILSEHEHVKNALVFGEGHFELGVIVELAVSLSVEELATFKSRIWPMITEANTKMDQHARILSQEGIIVLPFGTTFPRSDKGSIMRKDAYRLFDDDITKAYKDLENIATNNCIPLDMDRLEEGLRALIQTQLGWRIPEKGWNFDDDFFELGMDSLQAVRLRRLLVSSTGSLSASTPISSDFIYLNPSVAQLARALQGKGTILKDGIEDFVDRYSSLEQDVHVGAVVLLTGSTGSLGSHILAHLANLPNVARIICLVRSGQNADPYDQQLRSTQAKGINIPEPGWSKIEVLHSNLAAPFLGLNETDYARLQGQITHIIHNAWPMNFKWKLISFKSQFQGLRNLLKLAKETHQIHPMIRARFLFVSSIATVGQYRSVNGQCVVPEEQMSDINCTNPFGYGEAKLVCEKIVERVACNHRGELEAASIRVGQVVGSTRSGYWNTKEHFPAIVKASQEIGAFPTMEGTLSWLPVDLVAASVSEVLLTDHPFEPIYHLENPVRQSWHDCLAFLASELGMTNSHYLPFDDWLSKVNALSDDDADQSPMKEISDFLKEDFERMAGGLLVLSTENTRKVSSTFRNAEPIGKDLIAAYINWWKSCGFLK